MQAPFVEKTNASALQHKPRPKQAMFYRAALALAAVIIFTFSMYAQATITITAVDNASNVEGLGTSTLIIYGGFAGSTDDCDTSPDETHTCDNCSKPPPATGDDGLIACNEHRAHPALQLSITLKSDTKDGVPTILANDVSGGTPVALPSTSPPTVVTKGTTTTVSVTWGNICNYAPVAVSGAATTTPSNDINCAFVSGPPGPVTLSVGVLAAGDSPTSKANSDFTPVNFTLVQEVGQINSHPTTRDQSLGADCDSASSTAAYGVCHFEAYPGDGKAYILNLQALNGFPNQSGVLGGTAFRKVRILAAEGGYDKVVRSSKIEDLDITTPDSTTSTDSQSPGVGFSVSPDRVSAGLKNGTKYYFKSAVVDAAGNVGYYTPHTADAYCRYQTAGRTSPCHEATPDEVAGILSKSLNCFVATAAYGSNMAPQVEIFRQFRNHILLKHGWGISFVKFYYEHSPKYANIIAHRESLRTLARIALWPLLAYAWLSLQIGAWLTLILFLALVFSPPTYLLVRRQRRA